MIWAIGDLQGCYAPFERLLREIDFKPERDRLRLVGDLVNRGKDSLAVIEYLYEIRDSVDIVLGNHDISLLACYMGVKRCHRTLEALVRDKRMELWFEWLRRQPFIHLDDKLGYLTVHAGISPIFDLDRALEYNAILQKRLAADDASSWLEKMMAKDEPLFREDADELSRERYALGSFTRMRYCKRNGELEFKCKKAPGEKCEERDLLPWFDYPSAIKLGYKIVFGHWSTLGYFERDDIAALDSGCLWRGKLTAKRLDTNERVIVQIDCPEGIEPKG